MPKSPDAFRTISEVAEWLGVQAHVLRFWESKFSQVKPIKRAGGRRYYRPADMLLIGGIKKLLHDDGLTIKGVQKILREQGASHVADQSQPLDDLTAAVLDAPPIPDADVIIDAEPETAEIVELTPAHAAPDPEPLQDPSPEGETITDEAPEQVASTEDDMVAVAQDTTEPETVAASAPQAAGLDDAPVSSDAEDVPQDAQPDEIPDVAAAQTDEPETLGEADSDAVPSFLRRPLQDFVELPSEPDTAIEAPPTPAEPEPEPAALKPRVIDLPPLPVESDMPAAPAALSALAKVRALSPDQATALRPLLAELTQLRDQMAQHGQSPHKD